MTYYLIEKYYFIIFICNPVRVDEKNNGFDSIYTKDSYVYRTIHLRKYQAIALLGVRHVDTVEKTWVKLSSS